MNVDAKETHVSHVFLTGDRAYKLLKPVTMSFLDHADRDTRLAAARRELELNRRIAPDVYLGLGDLHENGELVDHLIIMRRMPEDRRLSALVGDPGFATCVKSVARVVAAFHAAQEPVRDATTATAAAQRELWADNLATVERLVPGAIPAADHERVHELAFGYLDSQEELFASRISNGFVRDGHGDLIADDIFCLPDGPRILDCLAFRDDFRLTDVLADIGFLVMDLHRLAGAETARSLIRSYQTFSYEHHPASLAHYYVAYRAHVRAKVACLTHDTGAAGQLHLARRYHDLALHHLERSQVSLVLVGGAPGVGKSTVAEHLGEEFGAVRLVTDEIRKDVAGIGHTTDAAAPLGEGIYTPEMTARAYDEMLREAALLLGRAESVVLDASWSRAEHREAARAAAADRGAMLVEIECTAPPETMRRRLQSRREAGGGPSDATVDVATALLAARDPWPEANQFSTDRELEPTLAAACALLGRCISPPDAIDGNPRHQPVYDRDA